ncbi:PAS domain-containing protein [Bradyrhizobium sp. 62B]|uniref:PAS domain-containing sensor histidine kinase n=1 Tax=Bradyrhizobium sp. 62B TaxID=2898442 RepID=UPI0025581A33|nr:PAS domain-containing protein [Bradyrhizobium sp. 62B]
MTIAAFWRNLRWRAILKFAIAIVLAGTSALVAGRVTLWIGSDASVLLHLCGVTILALAVGPGPATLASVIILLVLLPPLLSPAAHADQFNAVVRVGLFSVSSTLILLLSVRRKTASRSLQLLLDHLQATIAELERHNAILRDENNQHRETATRAQQAEQEIRLTVDTVPALIARYRPDGFMDFRNKNWSEYTGLSQDNRERRRWGSALHPDDEKMVERAWREHIPTGEPFELEQRLRKANGEYRWHRVRRVPLRNESGEVIKWYAIALDIDDKKRADDALRKSEADLATIKHELQLMIDTIPVLVLRHRADGIIDFVNEVGRTYSGLTTTKWTSRTSRITHPDDVSRLEEAWDVALRTGEPFESEVRLRRADGEYRWFATRRVPLRRNREVIAWYAATYDIEDRKRAENALLESERRLQEAQMELTHASRVVTMGQFTASIAHEVNQPISALLTNADTALRWLGRQPPNLERAKPLIERIIDDGKRAADIVGRIRDMSRKTPTRKETLDINKAISEIVSLARGVISDNDILVKMQLSEGLPCVLGDKIQLQQVILNLVMNAVEAMSEVREGSRELKVESREDEPGNVLVVFRDSGPGLPAADTGRIFEPFYTTKPNGLGIGLSICRSIIESHGGQLRAMPNDAQGAVFSIMLPTGEDPLAATKLSAS